jgi:hypothetical protein
MEDPTMTEFFFVVTRLEDIAEIVDKEEQAKLRGVAEGFRTLADKPARYKVENDTYRQWSQTPDNGLKRVETRVDELDGDPIRAVDELIENIGRQLSDSQKQAFGERLF